MDETTDQIERHIQETRNDLTGNFSELQEKVKTIVDWRAQFEEHPAAMVGLAFGGGILLSALLGSPSSSRRRSRENHRNLRPFQDARLDASQPRGARDENESHASEPWNALKTALAGVAATRLSGYIENLLPGFKQEFDNAQSGKKGERGPSNPGQPAWQRSTGGGAE